MGESTRQPASGPGGPVRRLKLRGVPRRGARGPHGPQPSSLERTVQGLAEGSVATTPYTTEGKTVEQVAAELLALSRA